MRLIRLFFGVLLTLFLLVKGLGPFRDHGSFDWAVLIGALQYMIMFGSPQIFWLVQVSRITNAHQVIFAFIVVVSFALDYAYFGFFPGQSKPGWGGDAHFEVPAAFILEWAIALILFFPFRLLGCIDKPNARRAQKRRSD